MTVTLSTHNTKALALHVRYACRHSACLRKIEKLVIEKFAKTAGVAVWFYAEVAALIKPLAACKEEVEIQALIVNRTLERLGCACTNVLGNVSDGIYLKFSADLLQQLKQDVYIKKAKVLDSFLESVGKAFSGKEMSAGAMRHQLTIMLQDFILPSMAVGKLSQAIIYAAEGKPVPNYSISDV